MMEFEIILDFKFLKFLNIPASQVTIFKCEILEFLFFIRTFTIRLCPNNSCDHTHHSSGFISIGNMHSSTSDSLMSDRDSVMTQVSIPGIYESQRITEMT